MKSHGSTGEDSVKPVAYDQYGRPLYAHPPAQDMPVVAAPSGEATEKQQHVVDHMPGTPHDAEGAPQVVYMTRAIDPHQQEISPEVKRRHDESRRKYPALNLSEGEFVISAIRRHPIGIISIWAVVVLALLVILVLPTALLASGLFQFNFSGTLLVNGSLVLLMVIVLILLGGIVATIVYDANRFYLTNESVTQHIQTSLFSKKDQTISLGNVEDASFRQRGILQTILNYGSIRLSTEGEETTYRFNFVANPSEQIRMLNDAVEAFKNFRPIDTDES